MRQVSSKQVKINRKLAKVYKEIAEEREHYCTGCNRYDLPLSNSHIIPRSRRPDLVLDKRNITYHCLSINGRKGCHELWEGGVSDKQKLLDYGMSMEIIYVLDKSYYYLLMD